MPPSLRKTPLHLPLLLVVASGCAPAAASANAPPSVPPASNAPAATPADPLRSEADRRTDALIEQGFRMTRGITIRATDPPVRSFDFTIPPPRREHTFSFWADVGEGTASFRLLGPAGESEAAWSGHRSEITLSFDASVGRHRIEMTTAPGASGQAIFGVKGRTVSQCDAPLGGGVREVAASPAEGWSFPYLLYVPKEPRAGRLLVLPNNSGFASEDPELLRMAASCDLASRGDLANHLGAPVLVPLFPRPDEGEGEDANLYTHALSRAALETKREALHRVDLQLLSMIANARKLLHAEHVEVDAKVLMAGFSASGMFVNRFAMLHPEAVQGVACGSPGGWPIAPAAVADGDALEYPVGIADVAKLTGAPVDVAAVRKVSFLFLIGDKDENDAVPHRDSFSLADERLIFRRFGTTPVSRWGAAERLYKDAGLDATFRLYPGVAHSLSHDMEEETERFFRKLADAAR